MSKLYITGDTHADITWQKLNTISFPEQKDLTKEDYILICGDWGGIWDGGRTDKYIQKTYDSRNFTTLWIDGNHENFDLLEKYPVTDWCGGKVQFITPSIIHLMRGQIYTICNKKIFTMGGASSHDKEHRVEGKSWWPQEIPTTNEMQEAFDNLTANNDIVDIIVTHCAPSELVKLFFGYDDIDNLTRMLNLVSKTVKFNDWYFGHYHRDMKYGKFHAMYNVIEFVAES